MTTVITTKSASRVVINSGEKGDPGPQGPTGPQGPPGSAAWGGISGALSSQADLQSALDVGSTRIPTSYVSQNSAELLDDLKVTTGRFTGAYRSRDTGVINWYFAAQAMTLAPEAFAQTDRQAFCATAIDRGVVSPRQSTTAYTASTMVTFASGKVFFCNIAGTTTSPAPSDAAIVTAGSFLGDGTVTWEYTGLQVPTAWQWFLVDIASNLLTVTAPDSTDAYPAMLASAASLANVDAAWLNTASAHPGTTRMQVINNLIQNGMTDDLTGSSPGARLSYVFQNQLNPAGAANTTRYLADNVEVWRGYTAQAALLTLVGSSATAALQNAADVKAGILSTQLFASSRFKAYVGRPNWDTITGDAVYATDFRFHLFPSLYGMLAGVTEQKTYGDDVALYVRANVPGLFTASLDTFPMAESFYAMWRLGWETAKDVALWRVTSRVSGNVVISDAALVAKWLGFTYLAPATSGGGSGDVTAAAAFATDNRLIRSDGTGKGVQASAIDLDDNGVFTVPQASAPSAPSAGVKMYGRDMGGHVMPGFISATGRALALQASLSEARFAFWTATGDGGTDTNVGCVAASTGTSTAVNWASTNFRTRMRWREWLVTVASTTAVAGYRWSALQYTVGGGGAGQGGFSESFTWSPATGVVSTHRGFAGMRASTAAPTDVDPSSLLNICGMGYDSADTNIQFMRNDGSGTATKIDLGASFPKPTADRTKVYQVLLYSPPGTTQSVSYLIRDLETGAEATGTVTTDLPATTTAMNPYAYISVGGVSSVIGLGVSYCHIEPDV